MQKLIETARHNLYKIAAFGRSVALRPQTARTPSPALPSVVGGQTADVIKPRPSRNPSSLSTVKGRDDGKSV